MNQLPCSNRHSAVWVDLHHGFIQRHTRRFCFGNGALFTFRPPLAGFHQWFGCLFLAACLSARSRGGEFINSSTQLLRPRHWFSALISRKHGGKNIRGRKTYLRQPSVDWCRFDRERIVTSVSQSADLAQSASRRVAF